MIYFVLPKDFSEKFQVNLDSIQADLLRGIEDYARDELSEWEMNLKDALGTLLQPESAWNRVREDRSRPFPYMNSGELRNSVHQEVHGYETAKQYRLSIVAGIGDSPYDPMQAAATNLGIRQPMTAKTGAWVGWMDDVLFNRGRGMVRKSVRQIFDEVLTRRSAIRGRR